MFKLLTALLLTLPSLVFSQMANPQQVQGTYQFGGFDDTDSPNTLLPYEAQSLLNVESNIGATAIIKRKGFVAQQPLTCTSSTCTVTGAYYFIDKNGNQQAIVCEGKKCENSVNNGSFSVLTATATSGVQRWQFVDYNGIVYAVDDKNDQPWSYDGTTFTQPFSTSAPLGSIIESSVDRLIISGVATNPNGVYYSASGNFSQFQNIFNQSADAWSDTIGTSGDKVTGLKYEGGNLYIFKRQSITLCILADQFTTTCYPISNTIGTNSPASIVGAPDGIYFESQNKDYWRIPTYGLYGLELVSRKISNFVKSQPSQFGNSGSNLQAAQSDWQAGTQNPANSWNTISIPGSIFDSSITFTVNSSAAFNNGTLFNNTSSYRNISYSTVNPSIILSTPGIVSIFDSTGVVWVNAGGENGLNDFTNWVTTFPGNPGINTWRNFTAQSCNTGGNGTGVVFNPKFGSQYFFLNSAQVCGSTVNVSVLDTFGNLLISSNIALTYSPATWNYYPINISTVNVNRIQLSVSYTDKTRGEQILTSSPIIDGNYIPFWYTQCAQNGNLCEFAFDMDETIPQVTSGTYTSQCFDTSFSTPLAQFTNIISSDTNSKINFQTKVSSSCTGTFTNQYPLTGSGNMTQQGQEFVELVSSFTINSTTNTPAQLQSTSLMASTTGQLVTQCIQPGPNISSFGTFVCSNSNQGNGTEVFYATSAASCAALPTTFPINGSPVGWTKQTNNTALTISTNVAFEIGIISSLTVSTDVAQINACASSWFNGVNPQPVFGVFNPTKNAIYWSTANNSLGTNNRILKYDFNLSFQNINPWFEYDVPATAMRVINSNLYFGSSLAGQWNEFSNVSSDNGSAINAYWQSKDYSCNAPYQDSTWQQLDSVVRNQNAGTLTETFTDSLGDVHSWQISQATGTTQNYVRSNYYLPTYSPAPFMNVEFGDDTNNNPFEVDGFQVPCIPSPIIIENP